MSTPHRTPSGRIRVALLAVLAGACASTARRQAPARAPRLIAEWAPAQGVLVTFPFAIPDELVRDLATETRLLVLVEDARRDDARAGLDALGIAEERVELLTTRASMPWTRDWGPHQLRLGDGRVALVDHVFDGYPWGPPEARFEDLRFFGRGAAGEDAAAAELAAHLGAPCVELPAVATGGNLLTDGRGRAFCTALQIVENSPRLSEAEYRELLRARLGVEDLVVLENTEEHGIQHIDCWLKVLDETTLLVKRAPPDHFEHAPIERNVERLRALRSASGEPYRIVRVDCPRFRAQGLAAYTNSLMLNGVVHVPLFGIEADAQALAVYRAALPGREVRGYRYDDWRHFDALHCRTRALFAARDRAARR